jgi:hypothetical protein
LPYPNKSVHPPLKNSPDKNMNLIPTYGSWKQTESNHYHISKINLNLPISDPISNPISEKLANKH